MPEVKPARKHVYEAAASSLTGVHLKAIDDHDLEKILGRKQTGATSPSAFVLTKEIIEKLVEVLKEL